MLDELNANVRAAADQWLSRAAKVMADPRHNWDIIDVPLHRGAGAEVWDARGRRHIDLAMAKGAVTLGHGHPAVMAAVGELLKDGSTLLFGGPSHELHVRLAEDLCSSIPTAEKVRFFKTGSCATSAALRIAKLAAGKPLVLSCGYHGWHEWATHAVEGSGPGPEGVINFAYDLAYLRELLRQRQGEVAAIFVTPEPNFFCHSFLLELKAIAATAGVLLILDEVKTGFRFGVGGYQMLAGVDPDLSTFSKGLANGFSISAVVGKGEIMDFAEHTNLTSTYQGELTPYVAALACLEVMRSEDVIEGSIRQGRKLVEGIDALLERHGVRAEIFSHPNLFHIVFEDYPLAREFHSGLFQRGVVTYPFDNQTVTHLHDDAIVAEVLTAVEDVALGLRKDSRRSDGDSIGRISRAALDRYTLREFGGVIGDHLVTRPWRASC